MIHSFPTRRSSDRAGGDLGGIGVTDARKVPAAPAPGRRLGWRGTPVARFAAAFGASPVAVAALTVTIVLALLATFANFITPQNPYDLAQLYIMDGMLPPGSTDLAGAMTYHHGPPQQVSHMLSTPFFRHHIQPRR